MDDSAAGGGRGVTAARPVVQGDEPDGDHGQGHDHREPEPGSPIVESIPFTPVIATPSWTAGHRASQRAQTAADASPRRLLADAKLA